MMNYEEILGMQDYNMKENSNKSNKIEIENSQK